jgi:hypothetical protein
LLRKTFTWDFWTQLIKLGERAAFISALFFTDGAARLNAKLSPSVSAIEI